MVEASSRSASEDTLLPYRRVAPRFPVLSAPAKHELARQWRDCQSTAAADKRLALQLRLVAKIATDCRGYTLPTGEPIGEGAAGTTQAVKRFDPDRGFRLASYAYDWIRAARRTAPSLARCATRTYSK
jgi:DNA-directed RNA polymerase sigma subunit (sigma70/sigma32)